MEKDINSAKYLTLKKIVQESSLELRIYISEAVVDEKVKVPAGIIGSGSPIVTNDTCARYEFIFKNYVCYSVRNESFARVDKEEEYVGNLYRICSNSKFLDYVYRSCIALDRLAPKMKHYEIVCLNHIIDVASEHEPLI